MKLSSVTLLLSLVVLASLQVVASPIRIIEISTSSANQASPFRLGHAAAFASNLTEVDGISKGAMIHSTTPGSVRVGPMKWSCKMRKQALKMSNWFRQQLGLPTIEPMHRHMRAHGSGKMMPHHPRPIHGGALHILPFPHLEQSVNVTTARLQQSKWEFVPPHGRHHGHRFRPATFTGRLHKALMTLGPWEGRALAFVIGCGIGSLIRMFWVMAILALRSFSTRPAEGRIELVDTVVIFDEAQAAQVPATQPPQYEEKVAVDAKPLSA